MRAYYIPAAAGVLLVVSAFLPWMSVGDVTLGGVPDTGRAVDSRTRRSWPCFSPASASGRARIRGIRCCSSASSRSRSCFSVTNGWRATVRDSAWAQAQARAIVDNVPAGAAPADQQSARASISESLAAIVLVGFGLTIVIKRVPERVRAA